MSIMEKRKKYLEVNMIYKIVVIYATETTTQSYTHVEWSN
jgi:hypothetical protein